MNNNTTTCILIVVVIAFVCVLVCAKAAQDARKRAEQDLLIYKSQVETLSQSINALDAAIQRLEEQKRNAAIEYIEKEEIINSLPSDWLDNTLPAGVCDAFGDYTNADNKAP